MDRRFEGKAAIVTGSSSGIGKATALRLAGEGAKVCVVANHNVEGGEATAHEVREIGEASLFVQADVSSAADCQRLVAEATSAFGGVHILVNNAGLWRTARLEELTEQIWDQVLDTNLKSAYLLSRLVVTEMLRRARRTGGSVVSVSSVHAASTQPGCAAYAASKAGMCGMTRALAVEFGSRGIRFNCILPGTIDTSLYPRTNDPVDRQAWRPQSSEIQIAKRLGTPDEIAAAVCFVASDEASFINGAALIVDGGLLTHLRDFA